MLTSGPPRRRGKKNRWAFESVSETAYVELGTVPTCLVVQGVEHALFLPPSTREAAMVVSWGWESSIGLRGTESEFGIVHRPWHLLWREVSRHI